jgi:hypothetical protein
MSGALPDAGMAAARVKAFHETFGDRHEDELVGRQTEDRVCRGVVDALGV